MKKKLLIFVVLILSLGMLGIYVVPPSGDDAFNSGRSPQGKRREKLVRLLMVQDESKVDAFLAKAKGDGKITDQQAANIKNIWTNHHGQFAQGSPIMRLLQTQDVTKVQAALDKAVGANKITQQQAERPMDLWQKLHHR